MPPRKKDGFAALAYLDVDDPAPMSLSLLFKTSSNHATLILKSVSPHPGDSDTLTFLLQINPGDLKPSQVFLRPASIALPQDVLSNIQRDGRPQISTLRLPLGQRCSIWYPKSVTTAPTFGRHPPLDRLASFATAQTLYLVFDENWLSPEPKKLLKDFVLHPKRFSSYPDNEYLKNKHEPLDWSLFNTPAYCEPATALSDPTPPYPSATAKRSKRSSNTPTSPPSAKRLLTSHDPEAIDTNTVEEDGRTTPHTKLEHFPKAISEASTTALSSSSSPGPPGEDLRLAVENALETSLTARLATLIPSLIAQLVAAPSPTPSEHSIDSHRSTTPPPLKLSPFGELLGDYVARQLKGEVERTYELTQSHAEHMRSVADAEFIERVDEQRLALTQETKDQYGEFRQKCYDLEEETFNRLGWRLDDSYAPVEEPEQADDSETEETEDEDEDARRAQLKKQSAKLQKERAKLKKERAELNKERAKLNRKSANVQMEAEDLRRDRNALRMDREDVWRREAQLRREQKALKKEKQS